MVINLDILGFKHKLVIDNSKLEKCLDKNYGDLTIDDVRGLYDDDVRELYVRDGMN